jgi:DNA-binding HxlR family transcriptional regulator
LTYRRYKYILDYAIVDILDTKHRSYLRYHELEQEISLHCKLSSATLVRHLTRLVGRNVLERRIEQNNSKTFYSLTKEFKVSLDIQKKHYPKSYFEKTLSLNNFTNFDYGFTLSKAKYSPNVIFEEPF